MYFGIPHIYVYTQKSIKKLNWLGCSGFSFRIFFLIIHLVIVFVRIIPTRTHFHHDFKKEYLFNFPLSLLSLSLSLSLSSFFSLSLFFLLSLSLLKIAVSVSSIFADSPIKSSTHP